MADTRKPIIAQQNFYGGIATDEKTGIKYSHAYSRCIDFRKKPSQMSILPGGRDISTNKLKDLILDIIEVPDGTRYATGDLGYIYRLSTAGVLDIIGQMDSGAGGIIYREDTDSVYITSQTSVSRINKVSTAPTLELNKYATSVSTDTKASRSGGSNSYTVPTAVDEGEKSKFTFQPDIEPLYSVKVRINNKGTGNWTVTIHDAENTVLGTSTIANASLNNGDFNEFTVTPIRMLVKPNARTYHVHLTSTVADGTVFCSAKDDLNTVDFQISASRFVDGRNGFHPVINFQQYTCFGNERYLSIWEPLSDDPTNAEWLRHRLTFPPGYEVCGLATTDEFLVCACEKKSTNSSKDFQDGKLFIWDGQSTTYNFFIDIPEGSPQSIYSYMNIIYMIVNGALYVWSGGKTLTKVRTLINTDTEYSDVSDSTIVYPKMMAIRRGVMLFGYPSTTNNQDLEFGLYSWGALDKNYPQVFGYSYTISTLTRTYDGSNTLRIGCVKSFGDELYISWEDDTQAVSYGLDLVDNNSNPAPNAVWESLIFDGGAVFKRKNCYRYKITAKDLPDGVIIKPKYKIDRATSWTYGADFTSGTSSITTINSPFYEFQYGFDIECTGTETPEIIGVAIEIDPLANSDSLI